MRQPVEYKLNKLIRFKQEFYEGTQGDGDDGAKRFLYVSLHAAPWIRIGIKTHTAGDLPVLSQDQCVVRLAEHLMRNAV